MPDVAISCDILPNRNIVPGDRHGPIGPRDDTKIQKMLRKTHVIARRANARRGNLLL